jgi:hypothetical protein
MNSASFYGGMKLNSTNGIYGIDSTPLGLAVFLDMITRGRPRRPTMG